MRERKRERSITALVCRLRKMSVLHLGGYATHSILFHFFVFRGDWGGVQISSLLFFFLFPTQHTSFALDTPIDFQNNPLSSANVRVIHSTLTITVYNDHVQYYMRFCETRITFIIRVTRGC